MIRLIRPVTADFVFLAVGNRPNTSILSDFDSAAVNPENKLAKVESSFQVQGHPHMFAIGDIVDIDESKVYVNAKVRRPCSSGWLHRHLTISSTRSTTAATQRRTFCTSSGTPPRRPLP